jgi:hypothetical protein
VRILRRSIVMDTNEIENHVNERTSKIGVIIEQWNWDEKSLSLFLPYDTERYYIEFEGDNTIAISDSIIMEIKSKLNDMADSLIDAANSL